MTAHVDWPSSMVYVFVRIQRTPTSVGPTNWKNSTPFLPHRNERIEMDKLLASNLIHRFVRACLIGILTTITVACYSTSKANKTTDAERFTNIYQSLSLVHFSPDYPAHPQAFSHCVNNNKEGCFRVIERVKDAVSSLKAPGNEVALESTINGIVSYCINTESRNDPKVQLCEGALTSIYLFNDKDDDSALLNAFKKLSKEQNARVFDGNKEWYYNRKNVTPWIDHVKDVLEDSALELQLWRFSQKNVKPFGLMYLESSIFSGENLTY
jgi:hypothetical protein